MRLSSLRTSWKLGELQEDPRAWLVIPVVCGIATIVAAFMPAPFAPHLAVVAALVAVAWLAVIVAEIRRRRYYRREREWKSR
jgi:hypothetical protein